MAKTNEGLLIPVWPRPEYKRLSPETRGLFKVPKWWRSGRRISEKGRLRHVGGIEAMCALHAGFVHLGEPLCLSAIRDPA